MHAAGEFKLTDFSNAFFANEMQKPEKYPKSEVMDGEVIRTS